MCMCSLLLYEIAYTYVLSLFYSAVLFEPLSQLLLEMRLPLLLTIIVKLLFCQQSVEHLQRLFEKFVPKVLDFRRHHCKELIPTSELNSVASLCVLFDALATEENGVSKNFLFKVYFLPFTFSFMDVPFSTCYM